jgi:hypothetical protein
MRAYYNALKRKKLFFQRAYASCPFLSFRITHNNSAITTFLFSQPSYYEPFVSKPFSRQTMEIAATWSRADRVIFGFFIAKLNI